MKLLRSFSGMCFSDRSGCFSLLMSLLLLNTWAVPSTFGQPSGKIAAPSNKQLTSPEIEREVAALLNKMSLEEKLGQLVQYSDSGYSGQAKTAEEAANPGKNPTAPHPVDAMELVTSGKLGSLLNL